MRLWPRCVDDRGRACAFDASAVHSRLEAAGQKGAMPLLIGMLAAGAFLIVHAAMLGVATDLWRWVASGSVLAAAAYAGAAFFHAREIGIQRRIGRAKGVCAACGYPMMELEIQADGCRVCPECGSAWKLDGSAGGSASRPSRPSR